MDIHEIRTRKQKLTLEIQRLLTKFSQETSLQVTCVTVDPVHLMSGKVEDYHVELEVRIG